MSSEFGSSLEEDPRGEFPDRHGGAVLLADEIRYFSMSDDIPAGQRLIDPFEPERLRSASYQLTLGNQVHVGGRHRLMLDSKPLILEPHQVAVVSTSITTTLLRFGQFSAGNRFAKGKAARLSRAWAGRHEEVLRVLVLRTVVVILGRCCEYPGSWSLGGA